MSIILLALVGANGGIVILILFRSSTETEAVLVDPSFQVIHWFS